MREANDQRHPSIPIVRVWMFGEFVVEHLTSPEEHSPRYESVVPSAWQSRGTAMTLLKVLLCRRRRRATKDELIAAIWPQEEEGAKRLKHVERAFDAYTGGREPALDQAKRRPHALPPGRSAALVDRCRGV